MNWDEDHYKRAHENGEVYANQKWLMKVVWWLISIVSTASGALIGYLVSISGHTS